MSRKPPTREPLKDHVLLYDNVCPLCTAYSCAFVKSGMLEADGREPYQLVDEGIAQNLDRQRAANEIALVNRRTREVTYGARSLMIILQHRAPLLAPIFGLQWFTWLADRAYRFVSYNRRVIMPARDEFVYRPSFSALYRLLYLGVAWVVTATFLHRYSALLVPLIPLTSYGREFLICGGQILWQMVFMALLHKGKTWDYLGNLMTISLAGGIALGMIQLLSFGYQNPFFHGAMFASVAGLMFLEHVRRTHILGISSWLSVTWVLYRVILLGVILWLR